jgi:hypothetical protein
MQGIGVLRFALQDLPIKAFGLRQAAGLVVA